MSDPNFNWFTKARSRLWVKSGPDISRIPKLPLLVGTFFYAGLSPAASGTVGSLVAALLYWFIPALQVPWVLLVACAIVLIAGTWAGTIIEHALGEQDPGIVVIDEVLGQWVTLLLFQFLLANEHLFPLWVSILIAFLFFRLFDIIKLPPCRYFERRPGGFGIMMDDAVAGVYAAIACIVLSTILALLLKGC